MLFGINSNRACRPIAAAERSICCRIAARFSSAVGYTFGMALRPDHACAPIRAAPAGLFASNDRRVASPAAAFASQARCMHTLRGDAARKWFRPHANTRGTEDAASWGLVGPRFSAVSGRHLSKLANFPCPGSRCRPYLTCAADRGRRADRERNVGRVLTTGEAAEWVGLAASTLENLRVLGGGPTYLKLGRAVRYRAEDLDGWLSVRERRSTSEGWVIIPPR